MTNSDFGDRLRFNRLLNIFFYTSNIDKFLQARIIFARSGYTVRHFRSSTEPYDEEYGLGTREMLARALSQVSEQLNVRSLFFVEDTSLRIHSLSDDNDYPGLAVKDWFAKTSFEQLDRALNARGETRTATVKSDIALAIPSLSRPLYFQGEISGLIAESPPKFEASVQYPWLTPNTFNGWFIPDGADKRLGEMEFEESLRFDFRVCAFHKVIERLDELNSVLNLGPSYYRVRQQSHSTQSDQLPLLPTSGSITIIVVGGKCAGKTTFSDYIATQTDCFTLEASAVLRSICDEQGFKVKTPRDASKFLKKNGMAIVAERILDVVARESAGLTVITGLRTIEEAHYLVEHQPETKIVLIDCDSRVRFERHIRRSRDEDIKDFRAFQKGDEEQQSFGLLRIADELADFVIVNDSSMDDYHRKIADLLVQLSFTSVRTRGGTASELHRSLRALAKFRRAATCDEIADMSREDGSPVRRYNTNRALKTVPELAKRIEKKGSLLRYRILPTGRTALRLLDKLKPDAG